VSNSTLLRPQEKFVITMTTYILASGMLERILGALQTGPADKDNSMDESLTIERFVTYIDR